MAGHSLRRFRISTFVLRAVTTVGELALNIIPGLEAKFSLVSLIVDSQS